MWCVGILPLFTKTRWSGNEGGAQLHASTARDDAGGRMDSWLVASRGRPAAAAAAHSRAAEPVAATGDAADAASRRATGHLRLGDLFTQKKHREAKRHEYGAYTQV